MKTERKTCYLCGLEDIDVCETKGIHRSSIPDKPPCRFCTRNPEAEGKTADFHSETWCIDFSSGKAEAIIEDPDPHEQTLLKLLHEVVNIYEVKP